MKTLLLSGMFLLIINPLFAQNINDHKVNFAYIQLPLTRIDDKFSNYEVRVNHEYQAANEDSINIQRMRDEAAMSFYQQMVVVYQRQRDSLDKVHLMNLSAWEKKVNAGIVNPDGTALPQPAPPVYPQPPMYPKATTPLLHTELNNGIVDQSISLQGYEKGLGGFIITITVHPIQHQAIIETKKGTGTATKYEYKAPYILPISVKLETPTQGVLFEEKLFQGVKHYAMKEQSSRYDHELYMMDNKREFYTQLEAYARNEAFSSVNSILNERFGYMVKTRTAELYSVKNFKDYDYSDVTNCFTLTVQALQLVKNDRDRSGAASKIDEALSALAQVLEESNLYDNKARINDKITAMLQCNQAELLVWKAEFDKADAIVNIALNSGEGKAKRHLKDEQGFYADQRKRWDANY